MKIRRLWLAAAMGALSAVPAMAQGTAAWQIDPMHSNAQFAIRHLAISSVQGQFTKLSGLAKLDEQDIARSSVEATIDVASVDTRVAARDNDLRSPNFFDVANYPTMTFRSKRVASSAAGALEVTGDLTIHGVTREVTFHVEGFGAPIKDPWGNLRRGLSATTKINRRDFNLTYNSKTAAGDLVVGDQVSVTLDIELVKKP